ncbi:hypothetical protein BpHYR1_000422, partial [Brachionus plicatilis]
QSLKEKLVAFSEEKANSIEARENLAEKLSKCEAVKAHLEAEVQSQDEKLWSLRLELSRQDIAKIQLQDEVKMMEKKLVVLGIENSFFDKKLKELNGSKKQFIDPNFEGDSLIRFYGMKKTKCPFKQDYEDLQNSNENLRNESSMNLPKREEKLIMMFQSELIEATVQQMEVLYLRGKGADYIMKAPERIESTLHVGLNRALKYFYFFYYKYLII